MLSQHLKVNRPQPTIVRVDDVTAVPWRNGGGLTRELLAWPEPHDWLLRVSVADIQASGPFSVYAGVDRWFAVISGGSVRLQSAGTAPREISAAHSDLHEFSGDALTHCTAIGPATRDFNIMARRSRTRVTQQPLLEHQQLSSCAEGVGLFVVQAVELQQDTAPAFSLPDMALSWWPNPRRERLALRVASAATRGWWFEVDTDPPGRGRPQ